MLDKLEQQKHEQIRRRVAGTGYMVDEILEAFPLDNKAAKARLMVFLEYEELNRDNQAVDISEIEYACWNFPAVVIDYVHYLLDEVGAPEVEELPVLKKLIVNQHPELIHRFAQLERTWIQCLKEMTD